MLITYSMGQFILIIRQYSWSISYVHSNTIMYAICYLLHWRSCPKTPHFELLGIWTSISPTQRFVKRCSRFFWMATTAWPWSWVMMIIYPWFMGLTHGKKNIPGFSDMTCQQQRTSRYKLLYVKVIKFLSHAIDLTDNLVLYSFVSHFKRSTSSTLRLHAASTTLAHGDNDDLSWPLRIERKKLHSTAADLPSGYDWLTVCHGKIHHAINR